ncbi:hypothetical protein ACFQQB_28705 [Nonomuraea rubra]|uniref:hypothetical protein n=1 Tax=Nonomuraea rubra TaxID=46180 RepID=UPI003615902C
MMVTQLLMFAAGFTAYTYIGSLFDLPLPALLWAWGWAASWATRSAGGSPTRTGRAG